MERAVAAAYHSPFSTGGAKFHDVEFEGWVDTVTYGCWHREVFDRVGIFDEQLVRNQDDEFNLRLIRSGGTIWQSPRIVSWYRPRGSFSTLFRQYFQCAGADGPQPDHPQAQGAQRACGIGKANSR